jgi:hypothetical protein
MSGRKTVWTAARKAAKSRSHQMVSRWFSAWPGAQAGQDAAAQAGVQGVAGARLLKASDEAPRRARASCWLDAHPGGAGDNLAQGMVPTRLVDGVHGRSKGAGLARNRVETGQTLRLTLSNSACSRMKGPGDRSDRIATGDERRPGQLSAAGPAYLPYLTQSGLPPDEWPGGAA